MAVQKRRKTRSKRNMRRMHDTMETSALSIDSETGETHRRHHLTADGYYRGRQVIVVNANSANQENDDENVE